MVDGLGINLSPISTFLIVRRKTKSRLASSRLILMR